MFTFSYDGSSCAAGSGLASGEPPSRGRNPVSYNGRNTAADAGVHWRTSSVGAAGGNDYRHSGNHNSKSSQKMSDLNISRGHSPHFSPSRNSSKRN